MADIILYGLRGDYKTGLRQQSVKSIIRQSSPEIQQNINKQFYKSHYPNDKKNKSISNSYKYKIRNDANDIEKTLEMLSLLRNSSHKNCINIEDVYKSKAEIKREKIDIQKLHKKTQEILIKQKFMLEDIIVI